MAIIRESESLGSDSNGAGSVPDGPNENGDNRGGSPDIDVIIGAPDLASLITRKQTLHAKEYRDKIASGLKTAFIGSLQAGNYPDAATILWHGPDAATAIGDLCDQNEIIAKGVDLLTSPSSPVAMCVLTLMPLVSQLARNHGPQLRDVPGRLNFSKQARAERRLIRANQPKPEPTFTLKLLGRKIPVRLNFHLKLARYFVTGFMSQTKDPNALTATVFTDPKVQRQLEKMGITITAGGPHE